jgi:hypothetical protein
MRVAPHYCLPDPDTGELLPWHHSRISPEQIEAAGRGETLAQRDARLGRDRERRQKKKEASRAVAGGNKGKPGQGDRIHMFLDAIDGGALSIGQIVTAPDLVDAGVLPLNRSADQLITDLVMRLCYDGAPCRLRRIAGARAWRIDPA